MNVKNTFQALQSQWTSNRSINNRWKRYIFLAYKLPRKTENIIIVTFKLIFGVFFLSLAKFCKHFWITKHSFWEKFNTDRNVVSLRNEWLRLQQQKSNCEFTNWIITYDIINTFLKGERPSFWNWRSIVHFRNCQVRRDWKVTFFSLSQFFYTVAYSFDR